MNDEKPGGMLAISCRSPFPPRYWIGCHLFLAAVRLAVTGTGKQDAEVTRILHAECVAVRIDGLTDYQASVPHDVPRARYRQHELSAKASARKIDLMCKAVLTTTSFRGEVGLAEVDMAYT